MGLRMICRWLNLHGNDTEAALDSAMLADWNNVVWATSVLLAVGGRHHPCRSCLLQPIVACATTDFARPTCIALASI